MEDFELLRQYTDEGSHDAFAELVRRHVGLVRAAALRQMRDSGAADDVAQAVFVALARGARKVRRGERLSGWLLTATRYHATHARQSETRRRHHELRAAAMIPVSTEARESGPWDRIGPSLDEAIGTLTLKARDALLLRYFENKTVREVAGALRISEEAAKQRLSRAVEELRTFFTRRGVMVSAVVLAALLTGNAVAAVPDGYAAATAAASLKAAGGTGAAAGVSAGAKGVWGWLAGVKLQAAAAAVAVAAAGSGAVVMHHAGGARTVAGPRLAAAAAAACAAADDSWRQTFEKTYAPAEGEFLKRVPPPFIPERDAYFNEIDRQGNLDRTSEGIFTFKYNGQVEWTSWSLGRPTLVRVIGQVVALPSYRLAAPLKDRLRPVPGDWVVRENATTEQKMDGLGRVLREQLGWKVSFEKRDVEREVFVARGTYAHVPLAPDGDDQGAGLGDLVHLYVDGLSGDRGAAIGDVAGFLTVVGELMGTEVVDDTDHAKATVMWRNHAGAMVAPESRDRLLENVTKQTGLKFVREKRMIARWFLVPAEK
jgi:RNA polymerase sigma factor (sigma-70 family)